MVVTEARGATANSALQSWAATWLCLSQLIYRLYPLLATSVAHNLLLSLSVYYNSAAHSLNAIGGEPVEIKQGDMATFPAGMSCVWDVKEAINKHYNFH